MSTGRVAYLIPLVCCLLILFQGAGMAADRRVALVIGNGTYRNAPVLANPVGDAEAMAAMLRKAGFDSVDLRLNLDSLDLKRAIRSFLLAVKESDIAVVYFAGHGIEINGTNYVIPIDAKLKTDFDAEDEGLTLDRIIRAVEPARRLRLIILDACRDNPFLNKMQRTVSSRGIGAGLGKIEPEANTLVAYAARAGSVAEDGSGEHSPFTTALLAHLPTPGLDIRVAFGRVRDEVLRSTGGNQEPFVYGSLGGSTLSILREELGPDKPVITKRDPVAETRRDYEFAERVGTADAWTSFLQAHPTGFLADLARAQLAKGNTAAKAAVPQTIDATTPDIRRPAVPAPNSAAIEPGRRVPERYPKVLPPPMPQPMQPPLAPTAERDACRRDRDTLSRLREQPVVAEIERFGRQLSCEDLRPQLARLLESTGPQAEIPRPVPPAAAARPPVVMVPPEAAAPSRPVAARVERTVSANCRQESETLAQLRAAPDVKGVDRFARNLTCLELKPQVLRLRESLQED